MTVASVMTLPSSRFSIITLKDSSRKNWECVPSAFLIIISNEPSAASNWKPTCSSCLMLLSMSASLSGLSARSIPSSLALVMMVDFPESSETTMRCMLPTSSGLMCS